MTRNSKRERRNGNVHVDKGPRVRPEKPSGKTKDTDSRSKKTTAADSCGPEAVQQQALLDIFSCSFPEITGDGLQALIQEVKQHLYDRDFAKAFGREELLEAYAVRWSPTRALAYHELLCTLLGDRLNGGNVCQSSPAVEGRLADVALSDKSAGPQASALVTRELKVTCLGGGAGAELVAFTAALSSIFSTPKDTSKSDSIGEECGALIEAPLPPTLSIRLVDIADWASVTEKVRIGTTTKPGVSKYASATIKAQVRALLEPENLNVAFTQQDLLSMPPAQLANAVQGCALVTLFFTLNELYTSSVGKTTSFLLSLTLLLELGTLLLVVDSPGSYSTVQVGKTPCGEGTEEKKYPMQWLLDHTLLEASSIGEGKAAAKEQQWRKIHEQDSRWFRLRGELRYPVDLEDMRYQVHLYERV